MHQPRIHRWLPVALVLLAAREARTQSADTVCTYTRCALGLAPTLTGLDVVRGSSNVRITSLNFFLPRDLSPTFAGSDSAVLYARRAVSTRRAAAAFTDLGVVLLAAGAVKIAGDREVNRGSAAWLGAGTALFTISFPLQLRSDGELSRAVWWFNSHFQH